MQFETYYDKSNRIWYALAVDKNGHQIGDSQNAHTKELAIFYLGLEIGSNPSKFAQPLSEILEIGE